MVKKSKEIFKNIEILRFIFIILIALFHFRNAVSGYSLTSIFPAIKECSVCVDFFFVIAGFFLFKNIDKSYDTFKFAIKRFFRLAPLIWFSLLCFLFLSLISKFHCQLDFCILRALLLSNIGFAPKVEPTVVHWFVPVLFWVSVFYFYIAKIFDKKYLNLIIWLIVIISFGGFLNYSDFSPAGHTTNFYYFINVGILRGLAEIGLGYFISMLYGTDFLTKCSKKLYFIISAFEMFLIGTMGYYLLFAKRLPGKSVFVFIVIFSALFFLFLRKQGFISRILDNNFSCILGNSSYAIYIMHPVVQKYFKYFIYKPHTELIEQHALIYIAILTVSSIIIGFIVHYFVENRLKRVFSKVIK